MKRFEKILLVVILSILITSAGLVYRNNQVRAQENPQVSTARAAGMADYFAYEKLTITDTATTMTLATYTTGAKKAVCVLETASIRFRLDGGTPDANEGLLLSVGQTLTLDNYNQISKFKGIRTGGTSGSLKCLYGK